MLKKLFALILVAFFVFGGAPQTVPVAFAGSNDGCTIEVAIKNPDGSLGAFDSTDKAFAPGQSLVVRISNLREDGQTLTTLSGASYYLLTQTPFHRNVDTSIPVVNGSFQMEVGYQDLFNLNGPARRLEFGRNNSPIGTSYDLYCRSQGTYAYRSGQNETCSLSAQVYRNPSTQSFTLTASGNLSDLLPEKTYYLKMYVGARQWISYTLPKQPSFTYVGAGAATEQFDSSFEGTTHTLYITDEPMNSGSTKFCPIDVYFDRNAPAVDPNDVEPPTVPDISDTPLAAFSLCGQLSGDQKIACERCSDFDEVTGRPKNLYSAIGCIPIDEKGFLRQMIQLLLSVSGMIALLSILAGAFLLSTSQGDANQVKKAKELITAAVSGLLFIIFSTIILDFIGVQILRIPGLS